MLHRYPIKKSPFSSHAWLIKEIRNQGTSFKKSDSKIRILDFGCADAEYLEIATRDLTDVFEIYGIEPNPEDANKAKQRGFTIFEEDPMQSLEKLKDERFDIFILADILEHLSNPDDLIEKLIKMSHETSVFLISIPNIVFLPVRIQILFGSFEYTSRGPLDRTHLRFFTMKTVKKLIYENNLQIDKLFVSSPPFEIFVSQYMKNRLIVGIINVLEYLTRPVVTLFPRLLGYQFLIRARRSEELVYKRN